LHVRRTCNSLKRTLLGCLPVLQRAFDEQLEVFLKAHDSAIPALAGGVRHA
jgi:hypothetical protein